MLRATLAIALTALVGIPAGAQEGAAHVHWMQRDRAWYTQAGVVQANGDAVPDVVVAAGDRDAAYQGCLAPPGYPGFLLDQVVDTVLIGAAKLAVLDGRTGDPLWEMAWRPGGDAIDPPTVERYHLVSGVFTDDMDGDGQNDLVVLRTVRPSDGSDQTHHITSYDPGTGAVEWDVTRTSPGDELSILGLAPIEVFGEPGAMLALLTVKITIEGGSFDITIEGKNELVQLEPGEAPQTVVELPDDLGLAYPVPYGEGYRFISFPLRISGPPPMAVVDARAVDLTLEPDTGEPVFTEAWSRPGAGGSPAQVTGGDDPALVIGRIVGTTNTSNVVAMDLDTGADRWISPVDAGPTGGTFITADVNGDGTGDVIASPAFGDDPTGLFTGGFFAEVHALDGRTGQPLWTATDRLSKFRAWSLGLVDIDGTGGPELVGSMTHQDGFPLCSAAADDTGSVSVWDLDTGTQRCRLATDRWAADLVGAEMNGLPGDEIVAPTVGGNVYAFTNAEPGCGLLATNPLE